MKGWFDTKVQLPSKNGIHEITNDSISTPLGLFEYDGYGFLCNNHYIMPHYWREVSSFKEKRYGIIT